jgi:hypothetical protein
MGKKNPSKSRDPVKNIHIIDHQQRKKLFFSNTGKGNQKT